MFANNFKYAHNDVYMHVAHLLASLAVHGSAPDDYLIGMPIPIPEGRNAVTASENYGDITLRSVFVRILDSIILDLYGS